MNKYSFDGPLLGTDEQPIENTQLSVILSETLGKVINTEYDPLQLLDWAIEVRKRKVLTLDRKGQDTLEEVIKNAPGLYSLVRARLLERLRVPLVETVEKELFPAQSNV